MKKCPHNRQKSICKECGGSGICSHNKRKSRCKDCGGSEFCLHNKRKNQCKDCGGSQICIHNKQKGHCKDCGGVSYCSHNKQKAQCKECSGSAICTHGKRKSRCRDCSGSEICSHNKQKSHCKKCDGSSICIHKQIKYTCKECGGSSICSHNIQKSQCKECDPVSFERGLCITCKTHSKNHRYGKYCSRCFNYNFPNHPLSHRRVRKEHYITNLLKKDFPDLNLIFDKTISCQSCNTKRPDIFIELFSYCIIIEIDEDQHVNYSCDNKRMMEIFESLGNRPLVVIRFNPDSYKDTDGKTIKTVFQYTKTGNIKTTKYFQTRYHELIKEFRYWLNNGTPEKELTIKRLYFSN